MVLLFQTLGLIEALKLTGTFLSGAASLYGITYWISKSKFDLKADKEIVSRMQKDLDKKVDSEVVNLQLLNLQVQISDTSVSVKTLTTKILEENKNIRGENKETRKQLNIIIDSLINKK